MPGLPGPLHRLCFFVVSSKAGQTCASSSYQFSCSEWMYLLCLGGLCQQGTVERIESEDMEKKRFRPSEAVAM
jgi:hypothetical protein